MGRGGTCVTGIPDEAHGVADLDFVSATHVLTVEVRVIDVRVANGVSQPDDLAAQTRDLDPIDPAGGYRQHRRSATCEDVHAVMTALASVPRHAEAALDGSYAVAFQREGELRLELECDGVRAAPKQFGLEPEHVLATSPRLDDELTRHGIAGEHRPEGVVLVRGHAEEIDEEPCLLAGVERHFGGEPLTT